jgi:hypothetical protein
LLDIHMSCDEILVWIFALGDPSSFFCCFAQERERGPWTSSVRKWCPLTSRSFVGFNCRSAYWWWGWLALLHKKVSFILKSLWRRC